MTPTPSAASTPAEYPSNPPHTTITINCVTYHFDYTNAVINLNTNAFNTTTNTNTRSFNSSQAGTTEHRPRYEGYQAGSESEPSGDSEGSGIQITSNGFSQNPSVIGRGKVSMSADPELEDHHWHGVGLDLSNNGTQPPSAGRENSDANDPNVLEDIGQQRQPRRVHSVPLRGLFARVRAFLQRNRTRHTQR